MRLRSWLLLPAAMTVTLIGVTATPAHAVVTLTSGHVDVVDIDWPTGGSISISVLDDTGASPVERAPADVVFDVPAAAKTTVPSGSAWSFLGSPGSTVWVLPQSPVSGLLWAGWNTTEVTAAGSVTFTLKSVVSAPGNFSVYTVSLGTPTVIFNSGDGTPDNTSVLANRHKHANWAFTAAGTYQIEFEVSGAGSAPDSDIFTFTVQP